MPVKASYPRTLSTKSGLASCLMLPDVLGWSASTGGEEGRPAVSASATRRGGNGWRRQREQKMRARADQRLSSLVVGCNESATSATFKVVASGARTDLGSIVQQSQIVFRQQQRRWQIPACRSQPPAMDANCGKWLCTSCYWADKQRWRWAGLPQSPPQAVGEASRCPCRCQRSVRSKKKRRECLLRQGSKEKRAMVIASGKRERASRSLGSILGPPRWPCQVRGEGTCCLRWPFQSSSSPHTPQTPSPGK